MYHDFIHPAGLNGSLHDSLGPCDTIAYSSVSTPVIAPFGELENDLSGPYCLSFIIQANVMNTEPLLHFYSGEGVEIGNLSFVDGEIRYTVREKVVSFFADALDYQHFQLCTNGSVITFYNDCTAILSEEFTHQGFEGTDFITILANRVGGEIYEVQKVYMYYLMIFYLLSGSCC